MIDLQNLKDREIVFKITAFPMAMSGTVVNAENYGIWISLPELPPEVAQAGVLIQGAIKNPVFFVPFSQILFLVAGQE